MHESVGKTTLGLIGTRRLYSYRGNLGFLLMRRKGSIHLKYLFTPFPQFEASEDVDTDSGA